MTAWDTKLILTTGLTYTCMYFVSCANLGHQLMAQHCCLHLNICFNPPSALHLPPLQPPPSACTPPVDAICDITGIEKAISKPGLGAFK